MAELLIEPSVVPEVRVLSPVLCPLGFVHGYRCSACSWALLFPDCHVTWSVPFCYQVHAKSAFEAHHCGESFKPESDPGCRLCQDLCQSQ